MFCKKLLEALPDLYMVGGAVRDIILGRIPHDFDYTTPYTPEEMLARCKAHRLTAVETGIKYGTVTVIIENNTYEVTTFRKDKICDGRHAEVVFGLSLEEDLARRDFTINAMAFDKNMALIDPFGGQCDLSAQMIQTVGEPRQRFQEDFLRILRMCRFASRFSFKIEPRTFAAASELADKVLEYVSPERIYQEFDKAFAAANPAIFIRYLDEIGLFLRIFPEYSGAKDLLQSPKYHPEGSVWRHVLEVVERSEPAYLWHALLHDVGKVRTAELKPGTNYYGFKAHAEVGAEMIDSIAERLKWPTKLKDSVRETTRLHMLVPHMADAHMQEDGSFPDKPKRIFQAKIKDHFDAVLALTKADMGNRFPYFAPMFEPFENKNQLEPILFGRHLLEMGISPGPEMGKLLNRAYQIQIEEGIISLEELQERLKQELSSKS